MHRLFVILVVAMLASPIAFGQESVPAEKAKPSKKAKEAKKAKAEKKQGNNADRKQNAERAAKRKERLKKRFAKGDSNSDKALTIYEFLATVKLPKDEEKAAKRKKTLIGQFKKKDTNQDSKLTLKEFMATPQKNRQRQTRKRKQAAENQKNQATKKRGADAKQNKRQAKKKVEDETKDATVKEKEAEERNDYGSLMNEDVPLIKKFLQHESEFLAYLMAITRNLGASEEIYQNAAVVVMEHAMKGEIIRDFRAWAKEVVRRQALNYLRQEAKANRVRPIEPALLAELTRVFMDDSSNEGNSNRDLEALRECIQEVAEPLHRRMLAMRYEQKLSFLEIGRVVDKTEGAVQRALSRVRKLLHGCVRSKLALNQN